MQLFMTFWHNVYLYDVTSLALHNLITHRNFCHIFLQQIGHAHCGLELHMVFIAQWKPPGEENVKPNTQNDR
jgi:hypothetical protein